MIQTAVKHYTDLCDMPACMCVPCPVFIFLRNGLLTTEPIPKPYFMGTVTIITELSTGGVDVTIEYDDAFLPLDGGLPIEVIFSTGDNEPTVCDPDCAGECDWLPKVLLLTAAFGGLINRHYEIYDPNEDVANGDFMVPRIPFTGGFLLTGVRISGYTYDVNTSIVANLKVGATVIATYTGNMGAQRQLTLVNPLVAYDALPELFITGVVNNVYPLAAKGLVLELIGVIQ